MPWRVFTALGEEKGAGGGVGGGYEPGGTDVALADGGTGTSLVDPNADRILFWDDSAGVFTWLTPGTGLTITGTTIDSSGGGGYTPGGTDVALADGGTGASLVDPAADRVLFWDDSAGTVTWLTIGTGLSISGTTLTATGGSFPDYTVTNVTTDRSYDANSYTFDELADVLGTVIADLEAGGIGGGGGYTPGGTDVALADGGTGASLVDPGADRIMFWDDSASSTAYLTPGSGLTITGTTMTASGGGGGSGYDLLVGDYGAIGDGVIDDTAAIQAAIDAAYAQGGGIVAFDAKDYKVTTLQWKADGVLLAGQGRFATRLMGTAGSDILNIPDVNIGVHHLGLRDMTLKGGRHGIAYFAANTRHCTYLRLERVSIETPSDSCVYSEGAIEEWQFDDVIFSGGTYGFRHNAVNNNYALNYMDKCSFKDVWATGQSRHGWSVTAFYGGTCQWINPIVTVAGRHGFFFSGGFSAYNFININTEANGDSGKKNRTTFVGTVNAGATSATLASATGWATGDGMTIAGADSIGRDFTIYGTQQGGPGVTVSGTTVSWTGGIGRTVTNPIVTNAEWDDMHWGVGGPQQDQGAGPGGGKCLIMGGYFGGETSTAGKLRYSLLVPGEMILINVSAGLVLPVYDRTGGAVIIGSTCGVRNHMPDSIDTQVGLRLAMKSHDELDRSFMQSPNGKNFRICMRDSAGAGTGTYGQFELMRYDTARNLIFTVPGKGPVTAKDSFKMKTKAGVPTDADFDATPGDGTMAVDTTNSRLYVRIGGVWKMVAVA